MVRYKFKKYYKKKTRLYFHPIHGKILFKSNLYCLIFIIFRSFNKYKLNYFLKLELTKYPFKPPFICCGGGDDQ